MNKNPPASICPRQGGFNLLEVCLALILLGIVVGSAMRIYSQHKDQMAAKKTDENMRIIVKALSTYAESNNRIPCPTDPSANGDTFGFETGVPAATIAQGRQVGNCATEDTRKGLVPYQVLNIPYETIRDGWGRYFTYAISPIFTKPNEIFRDEFSFNPATLELVPNPSGDNADDGDVQRVHEKCREAGWVNAQEDPVNGPKARFCCAFDPNLDRATDIRIRNRDNSTDVSPVRAPNSSPVYSERMDKLLRTGDTPPAGNVLTYTPTSATEVEAAAFVLISHGPDGNCAYLGDDTQNRIACGAADAHAEERENANNNEVFFTGVRDRDFDDIVLWMTQFGLMAAGGSSSCNLP